MSDGSMPTADLPLIDLTVLDFSQFLAEPSAALRLSDLGAWVIKVERPDSGNASRRLYPADPPFDQDSALFHAINRGKQSLTADLKNSDDLALVKQLIATADVLIHNFRPGIMNRTGMGRRAGDQPAPDLCRCQRIWAGRAGAGFAGAVFVGHRLVIWRWRRGAGPRRAVHHRHDGRCVTGAGRTGAAS